MRIILINRLIDEGHSLMVEDVTGNIHTFDGPGISDLNRLLHGSSPVLQGASVADKIVGKAAASLVILAKVKELYADVISQNALNFLQEYGVPTTYGILVPHIVNRKGTGMCPLEKRCLPCLTPKDCLTEIRGFVESMTHAKKNDFSSSLS